MLNVVQSNRIDALAEHLAARLRSAPPGAFESESIVVPSAALGRWLDLRMATALGIGAGLDYPFPAAHVWSLFARVLPGLPRLSPFEPDLMTWRLVRRLGRVPSDASFESVRRYLKDGAMLPRYELARALAEQFERYAAYRPEWLEAWLAGHALGLGEHEGWQAALWRDLAADAPGLPHEHPKEAFFAAIGRDPAARARLPARLSFFAIDSLAPLYLEVVQRLSEHVEVHVYLMNPCREYWGVIERPSTVARAQSSPSGAVYREVGNTLFASLGQHGRDLVDRLIELEPPVVVDAFQEAAGATLLATLQNDVLDLHDRGAADRIEIAPDDRSLEIHVCHGEVREAEVLHDLLLDRFHQDETLRPEDVLVLCPDLDAYAPAIDAVFSSVPAARFIPFTIADRTGEIERPVVRSLAAIVATARGRLDAPAVAALLNEPRIAARFGFATDDLPIVREWIAESGIRWGEDEGSRSERGLPATRAFSWRAGLDRLVLGAAVASGVTEPIGGVVPFGEIEGVASDRVGSLSAFFDALAAFARELRGDRRSQRSIAGWCGVFVRAIETFHELSVDDEQDVRAVRDALDTIADRSTQAGFDEPVGVDLAWRHAEAALGQLTRPASFFAGGVTVARLAPGRIVPARIVCLIGLNDMLFPGTDRTRGFDLVAVHPRRGDRRRRDEDRYAFLSALGAARDALLITYTGRSVRDNGELPPSTAVADLLAAIERSFADSSSGVRSRVVVKHALQPGSPCYFAGGRLFTYAEEWRTPSDVHRPVAFAAGAMLPLNDVSGEEAAGNDARLMESQAGHTSRHGIRDGGNRDHVACDGRDPEHAGAAPAPHEIDLARLIRVLQDPARFFLRDRLGIVIPEDEVELEAVEPFRLGGLAGFEVRDRLLGAQLGFEDAAVVIRTLRARGRMPEGTIGEALIASETARGEAVSGLIRKALGGPPAWQPRVAVALTVGGWRVGGELDRLVPGGQILWKAGRISARALIDAWVRHLVLSLVRPGGGDPTTRVFGDRGSDGKAVEHCFLALEEAAAHAVLVDLIEIVELAATRVVAFYPDASLEFTTAERSGKADALERARRSWLPGEFGHGQRESERPYNTLATQGEVDPLGPEFVELARRVFNPLLQAMGEGAS